MVLKHILCTYMGTPAISMKVGETLNKLMDNEYCMRDKLFQAAHTFAVSYVTQMYVPSQNKHIHIPKHTKGVKT